MEPTNLNQRPPEPEKTASWPLLINLGLLLLVVAMNGGSLSVVPGTIGLLLLINLVAALILKLVGGRMHFVLAFVLAIMVLLLIGLGVCALLLANH